MDVYALHKFLDAIRTQPNILWYPGVDVLSSVDLIEPNIAKNYYCIVVAAAEQYCRLAQYDEEFSKVLTDYLTGSQTLFDAKGVTKNDECEFLINKIRVLPPEGF